MFVVKHRPFKSINLLSVSEPCSRDKVVDLNVRNPNVFKVQSQLIDALSLAGIPRQELVLPGKIEPEMFCLTLSLLITDRSPKDSCEGFLVWIDFYYLLQCGSQRHFYRFLHLGRKIDCFLSSYFLSLRSLYTQILTSRTGRPCFWY